MVTNKCRNQVVLIVGFNIKNSGARVTRYASVRIRSYLARERFLFLAPYMYMLGMTTEPVSNVKFQMCLLFLSVPNT